MLASRQPKPVLEFISFQARFASVAFASPLPFPNVLVKNFSFSREVNNFAFFCAVFKELVL
jgi:hypothetical protein